MNQLKTAFLVVALTVLLVLVGDLWQGTGGMIVFLGIALVMNGVAYWFSDRIALSSAQAHEATPAEAPMLFRLADRLALQYGVPRPRVYVSPDPSPNAFATGRNPSHAAICVNDGLLRILDEEELYGVLAHEFGHVRNRDILIQLAISRSREYQADRTGAEVSGDPLALASALRKLERASQAIPSQTAQPAFAHLYIVNPLSGGTLAGLFSTHPPIEERIRRLEEMAGGMRRAS